MGSHVGERCAPNDNGVCNGHEHARQFVVELGVIDHKSRLLSGPAMNPSTVTSLKTISSLIFCPFRALRATVSHHHVNARGSLWERSRSSIQAAARCPTMAYFSGSRQREYSSSPGDSPRLARTVPRSESQRLEAPNDVGAYLVDPGTFH